MWKMFFTLEDVQKCGEFQYCGRIPSVLWKMFSTKEDVQECGEFQYCGGIPSAPWVLFPHCLWYPFPVFNILFTALMVSPLGTDGIPPQN